MLQTVAVYAFTLEKKINILLTGNGINKISN